jgi:formylmethanofuran dehydrogenase subunit E
MKLENKICDWCYKPIEKPSGKIHNGKPVCKPCKKLFLVVDIKG